MLNVACVAPPDTPETYATMHMIASYATARLSTKPDRDKCNKRLRAYGSDSV